MRSIQTNTMILSVPGNRGASLFSEKAHFLTTCKAGGGILPVGRARVLFTKCLSVASPEGQAMPQAGIACAVGSTFCTISKTVVSKMETIRRLPAKTCHRRLCRSYRQLHTAHFFYEKGTKTKAKGR